MENKNWMTEEDKKIAEKWEAAKKYKPGEGFGFFVVACLLFGGVTAVEYFFKTGTFGEPGVPVWLIVIDAILAVGLICYIVFMILRYKTYCRMEYLPEVKAYEERRKAAEQASLEARVAPLKRGHERNELIVCASATYDGHYDRSGTRQVYVDGRPCGQANPWAVLGLPSGHHSVYVVYTESVGGRIYQGQTDAVSVCADEESVVLYTCKNGTSIYPSTVRGVSSLGEIVKKAESDGAPAPNF